MQPIDWMQVGMVAFGAGVGTLIGYRLTRDRAPNPRSVIVHPSQRAALLALAAFLGCALAEDIATQLGKAEPGGLFLAKYIFAAATGIGQFARLRRDARVQASKTPVLRGSGT